MPNDSEMQDQDAAREEHMMYGHGTMTDQELNEKYPNRPHNHSKTLLFSELHLTLFNPLNANKKKPAGPTINRKKVGPDGPGQSPHEIRHAIIARFISRWRRDVGNDIYPALRLIIPEKDRERGMYGLKELTLGKLLVRVMKIDRNSEDGYNLLHWKLPGLKSASAMAGDFAGRCFEVISKRAMRTTPGDMTIAEVNEMLDRLSVAQKEENQRPIIETFYERMNAEELMWLIRMILRQMKVGATERTIFDIWHPDAENLFNISSSLKRVCWELYDPEVRLEGDDRGISLMQCFQPQLAAFQMRSMEQMVARMNLTEDDPVFWIEEKLDGERMQLHMIEDDNTVGGKRFGFWSRKAKDYTYLYGNGFEDENGSLTRHIQEAFHDNVRNIILDGEMITWDPKQDAMVPFGHLKTAALSEQQNPFADGNRPLFRVFDCLYLNDSDLTRYTLRDRRKALAASVKSISRRLEVHEYTEARQASEIDTVLKKVVAEASEGLVLKNPRSPYRLNDRNDDWIKVKPEYMSEFGESLDCVVVGGYYGSGRRGGALSSFLCGLRISQLDVERGANPQKCLSFFKVGGGFAAEDYAHIRHRTEGKWVEWNSRRPPIDWVELGGGDRQHEKPDVWIKPEDSVVLEVKAASVHTTDQFRTGLTLRFPRFKKLRTDKDWTSALNVDEFRELKDKAEGEKAEKEFQLEDARKHRSSKRQKRALVIQGQEEKLSAAYAGPATNVFEGLSFFVMSEAAKPIKKSKAELEQMVNANGGKIVASAKDPDTILVSEKNVVKAASIKKEDKRMIVKPSWLLDCIRQSEIDIGRPSFLLPFEPGHLHFVPSIAHGKFDGNVDEFGDSYTRDITPDDLRGLFQNMSTKLEEKSEPTQVIDQIVEGGAAVDDIPAWMFRGLTAWFVDAPRETIRTFEFAGGALAESLDDASLTHVVLVEGSSQARATRQAISKKSRLPRLVSERWIRESWKESTRLDEERFGVV